MPLRALLLALTVAGLVAQAAAAADVRIEGRDEPVITGRALSGGVRVLSARQAPFTFNLVGLHWQGEGTVSFRTKATEGRWGPWLEAAPESEDAPDPGTREASRRSRWELGNPYWTERASWIQYRLEGEVSRLRAYFLWSPPYPGRRLALAGTPAIIERSAWGANESIVRAPPVYAPRLLFAVVHHTAGRNNYGPGQSAAIVRGIQTYHVEANGWNDIGYSFLVDRFGQVFEGRAGGIDRNVVGAHAQGFNTGSTGIAVIGSYEARSISPEAQSALEALLAWRLDVAHVDPLASVAATSGGNSRFPPGTVVSLRAISAHRDTGYTACPGDAFYADLPQIAENVSNLGLPKLYDPRASPPALVLRPDGTYEPIRFTARLSSPRSWSVTVSEKNGLVVAVGSGAGTSVDWTWDGTGPAGEPVDPAGAYEATIAAGDAVRPATLALSERTASLSLTALKVRPAVLTPNGDGVSDAAKISFALSLPARVRVRLEDVRGGPIATIAGERELQAGPASVSWTGVAVDGTPVPDGRYRVVVIARKGQASAERSVPLVVDRTLGGLAVSPRSFSPNGDGRLDELSVSFALTRSARVRVLARSSAGSETTIAERSLAAGSQRIVWDGRAGRGPVADGAYTIVVEAETDLGRRRLSTRVTLDTTQPALAVLDATARGGTTRIRLSVSERVRIKLWTDAGTRVIDRDAGESTYVMRLSTRRVRLVAWDAAGNASRTVRVKVRT